MTHVDSDFGSVHGVRDDFVPKDSYLSREFAALEKAKLWPCVWQIACRLEEVPKIGDYVTFEVIDESIIIVRTSETEVKAFYNACQHRGRKLTDGCGHTVKLFCRYHGWRWNLDGSVDHVVDREDWGDLLQDSDLKLKSPLIDFWGGWVFINMDPDAQPLLDYLSPIHEVFKNYEFEKLRYRWCKTTVLPCNWKVAIEAFDEGYHVQTTHRQILPVNDDGTASEAFGAHGMFYPPPENRPPGLPSRRLNMPIPNDTRGVTAAFFEMMERDLKAIVSINALNAARKLVTEGEPGSHMDVLTQLGGFQVGAALAEGSGWPMELSPAEMLKAGLDWHVFPNHVFLPAPDAMLAYRARPNGDDPDSCIFDVWSLMRYAPGKEPPINREFYRKWQEHDGWGLILTQDFNNLADIQNGMKSRGFEGARPSPVQERAISNFHKTLRAYVLG